MDKTGSPMSEKTAGRWNLAVALVTIALNVAYWADWLPWLEVRLLTSLGVAATFFFWGWSRALRAHRRWLRAEVGTIVANPNAVLSERDLSRLIARSYNVARGR